MVKVSDYIIARLVEHGVRDIFLVTGGGSMHLNDSIGANKNINYICNHHEQACAIAAEGYARTSGDLAVVNVTTGPGGTNALTGVIGQWLDSIPVLYISGQVKFETTIHSCPEIGLRQLGDQEIDIVSIVKPVTKFAQMITDPYMVKYYIDKAVHIAKEGRSGPVWLDIPLDIQGAMIDEAKLAEYKKDEVAENSERELINRKIDDVSRLLLASERPVIVAGHGIRLSNGIGPFNELLEKLRVPVLTTFNGFDLVPSDYELFGGRIGTVGTRVGNFILQNADLILFIGTRNNIRQVSYNWSMYARAAKKVVVDIDENELHKKTVIPDVALRMDTSDFIRDIIQKIAVLNLPSWENWIGWCQDKKKRYPMYDEKHYKKTQKSVEPYGFIHKMTGSLSVDDIVVAGNGSACVILFQAGIVKKNQRIFWNSGCASMGYDLPAAIGAAVAAKGKRNVICLAGDGSLQMNIQELQTLCHYKLPVKLIVLNNNGYISIKQTQNNFFNGREIGNGPESGVSFPDAVKLANAYGIPGLRIEQDDDIESIINELLTIDGPVVCEVMLSREYTFQPKLSSEKKEDGRMVSKPLEDMWPFLDREEFKNNMIIPIIEEK